VAKATYEITILIVQGVIFITTTYGCEKFKKIMKMEGVILK